MDVMRNKFLKIAVVLMGVLLTHTVYGQDLQGAREGLRSYTGHLKESATGQRYDQSSDSWVPEPKGLREKQLPIFEEIKSYVTGGGSNGYLQAPTGIGKTVLFVKAIEGMLEGSSEGKVLIVVPNINLISQVRNEILSFSNFGLDQVGLYYSDISKRNRPHELTKQIVITTYKSFAETTDVFEPNDYVGLILDEVHRGTSELRESKILEFIKNTIVLGFTATPEFNEQKTVNSFLDLILKISVVDAIEKLGLLSNFRSIYYQFEGIDISEADKGRGDFDEIKLGRILDNQEVYEAAIEAYKAYKGLGGEKLGQTVVYCSGIEHAELTAKAFKGAGIEALAIHSGNDMYSGISGEERDKILKAFKAGTSKYKVLVNVNVLVEGFDAPFVRFIINLAPTMSRVIAEQRGGRGLRLIEGLKGLFGRQDKTTLILEFLYSNAKRDKNGKLKQVLYDHLIGKGVSWRKGTKAAYIKSIESEIKTRSERLRKQLSVKKIKIHDSLKAIGAVSKAYTKQEKAGLTYDASGKMMWQGMYIEDLREVAIEIGMTSYQNKGQYKRLVDKLLEGGKTAPGVSYWEKMLKSAGVTTAWFYGKVDKHGKMMWQGMSIEDLKEVAIEIGMTSYRDKDQYKRLVDKLLEGGKTAPGVGYWEEMLKDAGMTSSEFYGKKGYKSVDEHGKMMWDGMSIEDLREVAIEIGMTSYHNKDQYKHLVDKLLEGGKTAPPVRFWEKMLKSAGVTKAWFYGKVDKHGKMMWDGMYIEDLREVAIEIGMTSYQNKGQYKRLVDKLLEGGKTAPPANYWKEMLKDAGMTSSQFYGKDNSTTLGMGFADWFKAGGKLEGFVERGKGLAKQGLTKLKEVFYPEGPGGEDSKRDKSKESKEHGKKEVQAVEKADENKNKPKGSPEEFRQDKKVASGDQPIAKPKANEKGNGSETLNEGAPQKPNAADTPPVEKTLTPEQVEAQKKYEKIKLRFDNAAEEIIKSDAEALESKKMRVKIEQAYQDALKLSVKDRLDKIIAFDSYLKEQSPGSSADKKSFIKSYSGETGKFFAAIWFATFLEIATDSDQDLSYFLETLAHTPTEFLRFMTFSLGAGAGSNVAMGVEGLIAAKLSHTKGLLAYEGALFQKMKVEAGIMGAVAREQAKLMVRNQIGFMAGIMLNKILFEGYTEHFWSELMLEFGSFLGAQLTVKTGTRGAKVLYTLRRYGKVGWKTIKLGSGPGGWIMGMAELGAEIFLAKHFSQMYLHSRAKADGEGELGRNMLRFKRALKGEEDLEAYFPQKAICKQLKGFDLKHCLENVLVQNINAYMLNVIFSKLNFFVANKQLQEQQISDSFGMGHALTDAYFVRKPHIGKNPLAAPYEAAIAKHHTKLADGLKRHMQEIYKTMTPDQNKWMSWLRKQEESIEEIINAACDQDVSDLSDYNHMRRCMGAAEEGIQKMSEHMDLMVQSFGIQRSGLSRFLYRGQPTFVSRYQTIEPKRMIDLSQLLNVVLDYGRDLMLAEDITLEDKEMVSRLMNRVIEDLRTWVGAVTRPEAYQASLLKIEVGVQEPTQLLTVLIDEMAYPGLEDMFKDIKQKYAVDVVDDLLPYVDTQSGTFSIKPESEAQPEFSITIDQAGDTSWKPIVDSQHRLEGIVQKTTAVVLPEGMDVGSVEAMGMVADILVSKITHPEMGESQYTDDSGNMSREMVYERMAEQQRMDGFFKSKIISDMKNNKHVTFIFDQSIESKNTYLDAGLIIQFFSEDTSIETQDPRIQLRYRATMTVPAPVIDALNQTSKAWSNK